MTEGERKVLKEQKQAFRRFCYRHKHLYRMFSQWFERRNNCALRRARQEKGIDNNLVVFSSYNMRSFNDNPFYICKAVHAMRSKTDLVWIFKNVKQTEMRYDIPDYVRCVEWKTPEGYEALGRARVVVDNWQKYDWLRLGRDQVYLFSPHHDRSFKTGLFASKDWFYNRTVESGAAAATVGSGFCKGFLHEAYHFQGEYIDCGQPRNDLLVHDDPEDEVRIRARLGVAEDVKLLLLAPTYRDAETRAGRGQHIALDIGHILDTLEASTRARWLCLVRAHYLALGLDFDRSLKSDRIMDVTAYPEMAELLRVSDALITDYSCCAGDFALRGKPIWLYIADIDEFTKNNRGLYVDPRDTPYWCAKSPRELDDLIRKTTPRKARENCLEVLRFYDTHETGRAAEAAARYICAVLDGEM